MNLTVAEARERIAAAAGLCTDDARVVAFLNRAVRRLLPKGKWVGTYDRLRLCISNANLVTLPRRYETIEAGAVSTRPIKIRNDWFEFLEAGLGLQNDNTGNGLQALDRGAAVTFADITAQGSGFIRVYADVTEAASKYIYLLGDDENGNRVRTQVGSTWIDGERVAIPTVVGTPTVSTKRFSKLVRVIKDATNGVIRIYEYDGASNVQALAYYDPDEKLPTYRRYFIPGLNQVHSNLNGCTDASVEFMAKLRYYAVANENDFVLIGNLDSLETEVRALLHFDNKNWQEGYTTESYAVKLLQEELSHVQGDGPAVQFKVQNDGTFGAGFIENAV